MSPGRPPEVNANPFQPALGSILTLPGVIFGRAFLREWFLESETPQLGHGGLVELVHPRLVPPTPPLLNGGPQ
jgi:hypothetical protein